MAEELDPTVAAAGDPEPDTTEPQVDDTGANTPDDTPVDWEGRYKAAQAELTRKSQALAALGARKQEPQRAEPAAADDLSTLSPNLRREIEEAREIRQAAKWEQVRAQYGDPLVDAYVEGFIPVYEKDPESPSAVMEGLVSLLNHLAKHAPAQTKPSRAQAVQPRVDTNQADAPDKASLDKQIEDAKAGKGKDPLMAGIIALRKKAGFEY